MISNDHENDDDEQVLDDESVLDGSELLVQINSSPRTRTYSSSLSYSFQVLVRKRKRLWLLAAIANIVFIYFIIHQFRVSKEIEDKLLKIAGGAYGTWGKPSGAGSGKIPTVNSSAFIINTPTCKIPELDMWDDSLNLLQFKCEEEEETDPECRKNYPRDWIYSNATSLIVNETAIVESGYSWESLHCCYRVITRVEQTMDNYDWNADNKIKVTDSCIKIQELETRVNSEFIRVFCLSTSIVLSTDVVYRNFFAFPQFDDHALQKVDEWKEKDISNVSAPNVVMIMLDSNSRLNFHRRLPLTLEVLQKAGAQEFFGHTKTSENTYPNTVNFLTGMSEEDMKELCHQKSEDVHDACPFIWKDFDRAGYLTSTIEDLAIGGTFTYLKNGFVRKPTDFYFRPMTWAWMKLLRRRKWFVRCIGPQQSDEFILDYILKILASSSSRKTPAFIHSQFAVFSHSCINGARFQDKPVSDFIKTLFKNHPNTILFVFSDHGDRHGKFRESLLGWYEDKLPAFWVHLPDQVRSTFPEWSEALRINSRRLTNHYDIYHTLLHIIQSFNLTTSQPTVHATAPGGQSLFIPVPENRTCAEASIPGSYCACAEPLVLNLDNINSTMTDLLKSAVDSVLTFLEKTLPPQCVQLKLKKLVSAKIMDSHGTNTTDFFVSFYSDPGDFLFEARTTMVKDPVQSKSTFSITSLNEILRMNRITRNVNCVTDPTLERFCYCS